MQSGDYFGNLFDVISFDFKSIECDFESVDGPFVLLNILTEVLEVYDEIVENSLWMKEGISLTLKLEISALLMKLNFARGLQEIMGSSDMEFMAVHKQQLLDIFSHVQILFQYSLSNKTYKEYKVQSSGVLSHDDIEVELLFCFVGLHIYSLGHDRLLGPVGLGNVIQSLLQALQFQHVVAVSHIQLQLLDVIHHVQELLYQCLHADEKPLQLLCEIFFAKLVSFRVQVFYFFRDFLQLLLIQHKAQKSLRIVGFIIPARHLESEPFVQYLGNICGVEDERLESIFELLKSRLTWRKTPVGTLQTKILKIDIAHIVGQSQKIVEVLESYILQICGVYPKSVQVFFDARNFMSQLLQNWVMGIQSESIQYNFETVNLAFFFEHLEQFQRVIDKIAEKCLGVEHPIPQTLKFNINDIFNFRVVKVFSSRPIVLQKEIRVSNVNFLFHLFGHERHFAKLQNINLFILYDCY